MPTHELPTYDYVYLNPDGTWTNGFKAWDDAVLFVEFSWGLVPLAFYGEDY